MVCELKGFLLTRVVKWRYALKTLLLMLVCFGPLAHAWDPGLVYPAVSIGEDRQRNSVLVLNGMPDCRFNHSLFQWTIAQAKLRKKNLDRVQTKYNEYLFEYWGVQVEPMVAKYKVRVLLSGIPRDLSTSHRHWFWCGSKSHDTATHGRSSDKNWAYFFDFSLPGLCAFAGENGNITRDVILEALGHYIDYNREDREREEEYRRSRF